MAISSSLECPLCSARHPAGAELCTEHGLPLVTAGEALVGTLVAERYLLLEELPQGLGIVFKARTQAERTPVLAKVLPKSFAEDEAAQAAFLNEARAMSLLQHPNVPTLVEFGVHEGARFMITEVVEGRTLANRLEQGPLRVEQALNVAEQLLELLEYCHQLKVVHGGLDAEMVLLEAGTAVRGHPRVRLLDLGAVRFVEDPEGSRPPVPANASPEVLRGAPPEVRSDLYRLGLLLFEMLCGAAPFDGDDTTLRELHMRSAAPKLRERYPALEIPEAVDQMVSRLLAKDPRQRPQSAAQVGARLQKLREAQELLRAEPQRISLMSAQPRKVRVASMAPAGGIVERRSKRLQDPRAAGGEVAGPTLEALEEQPSPEPVVLPLGSRKMAFGLGTPTPGPPPRVSEPPQPMPTLPGAPRDAPKFPPNSAPPITLPPMGAEVPRAASTAPPISMPPSSAPPPHHSSPPLGEPVPPHPFEPLEPYRPRPRARGGNPRLWIPVVAAALFASLLGLFLGMM